MQFPDATEIAPLLEPVTWPRFARVQYAPETPSVDDVRETTRTALDSVSIDLPSGSTVGVAVGSRGIHAIDVIVETVIDELAAAGYEVVIIPAMGSHGGATAAGQVDVLETLGITAERLGCPVDARMATTVVGTTTVGALSVDVHVGTAALEVDTVLPVNRVKPHTGFAGPVESGLCKMLLVGLGKQPGARLAHQTVIRTGFEDYVRNALPVLTDAVPVVGGIAIVENFEDETAEIVGVPGHRLIETETTLLERSIEYMPTLPFADLDILVVEELGKNVSGTGMDTNVIGRADHTQEPSIPGPDIGRIYVRGLTAETHGNANGVGLADVIHREVADAIDLQQTYANVITSGGITHAALPMVLPTDETALGALRGSLGTTAPDELRMAWIAETGALESFRISAGLAETADISGLSVDGYDELRFVDGEARFDPVD